VSVELAAGVRWVGFTGDHPRRPMIGVAVSLAVDWDDVKQDGVQRVDVETSSAETDAQSRKHPPAVSRSTRLVNYS